MCKLAEEAGSAGVIKTDSRANRREHSVAVGPLGTCCYYLGTPGRRGVLEQCQPISLREQIQSYIVVHLGPRPINQRQPLSQRQR